VFKGGGKKPKGNGIQVSVSRETPHRRVHIVKAAEFGTKLYGGHMERRWSWGKKPGREVRGGKCPESAGPHQRERLKAIAAAGGKGSSRGHDGGRKEKPSSTETKGREKKGRGKAPQADTTPSDAVRYPVPLEPFPRKRSKKQLQREGKIEIFRAL